MSVVQTARAENGLIVVDTEWRKSNLSSIFNVWPLMSNDGCATLHSLSVIQFITESVY
jgi:hypothetical protein